MQLYKTQLYGILKKHLKKHHTRRKKLFTEVIKMHAIKKYLINDCKRKRKWKRINHSDAPV